MRETTENTITLLEELRSELWSKAYSSWYNRDTMFSWEESRECRDYLVWEDKIKQQISDLEKTNA